MPSTKPQLNVRLSVEARLLLGELQRFHGLSQAGVLEMLIRKAARAEHLAPTSSRRRPA